MKNKKTVTIAGSIVEILGFTELDGKQGYKIRDAQGEIGFIDEETFKDSQ